MPDTRRPYFGHNWEHNCCNLDKVPKQNWSVFLICLYFTVLVDQAMYTYFGPVYSKFESLTKYPKFCYGLGQFHKNPRKILTVPVKKIFVQKEEIEVFLDDGMVLFVDEVIDFCKHQMPEINAEIFFEKLLYDPDVHIPLIVTLPNPELKDDIAVKSYESLKRAVEKRFQRCGF